MVVVTDKEQKEIAEANRYWIVPSRIKLMQSKNRQLTLADVPLELETEREGIKEGKQVSLTGEFL